MNKEQELLEKFSLKRLREEREGYLEEVRQDLEIVSQIEKAIEQK